MGASTNRRSATNWTQTATLDGIGGLTGVLRVFSSGVHLECIDTINGEIKTMDLETELGRYEFLGENIELKITPISAHPELRTQLKQVVHHGKVSPSIICGLLERSEKGRLCIGKAYIPGRHLEKSDSNGKALWQHLARHNHTHVGIEMSIARKDVTHALFQDVPAITF